MGEDKEVGCVVATKISWVLDPAMGHYHPANWAAAANEDNEARRVAATEISRVPTAEPRRPPPTYIPHTSPALGPGEGDAARSATNGDTKAVTPPSPVKRRRPPLRLPHPMIRLRRCRSEPPRGSVTAPVAEHRGTAVPWATTQKRGVGMGRCKGGARPHAGRPRRATSLHPLASHWPCGG